MLSGKTISQRQSRLGCLAVQCSAPTAKPAIQSKVQITKQMRVGFCAGRPASTVQISREMALQAVRADQQTATLDTSALELIASITKKVDDKHAEILQRNQANISGREGEDTVLRAKVLASIEDLKVGLLERETEVRSQSQPCISRKQESFSCCFTHYPAFKESP